MGNIFDDCKTKSGYCVKTNVSSLFYDRFEYFEVHSKLLLAGTFLIYFGISNF